MNFTLTISGETPAELLDTLTQLGGMTINVNTSPNGGVETHTMTAAELPRHTSPLPQSEPVQQPDKPKAADHRQSQKAHTGARSRPCGGACKPYECTCPECGCCCDYDRPCCPLCTSGNSDHPGGCKRLRH